MFDAVLCDMDGLLLDSEKIYLQAIQNAGADFGLGDLTEVYKVLVGTHDDDTIVLLDDHLGKKVDVHAFNARWMFHIRDLFQKPVPPKPTVVDVLTRLTDADVQLMVVTSTNHEKAVHHLTQAGIFHFFQGVIGGDNVQKGKPDPMPYLMAMDRLNVAPTRCVVFEDSATGVQAGLASGATVVQIPDLVIPDPPLAHFTAANMASGAQMSGLLP